MITDEITRRYYSIGALAKELRVATSTIRFWDKQFSVLSPKRTRKNVRRYTRQDRLALLHIRYLLYEKGFTIKGANQEIEENGIPDLKHK